jgi:sugar phosphate permease
VPDETLSVDPFGDSLIDRFWPAVKEDLPERARRRVSLHLLPVLFFLYILAYLDRTNIGVAALGMKHPLADGGLGFDDKIIGVGTGIFFWGYWILEIPSAISVLHRGARFVFCRVLVLWGICATLMGFIGRPWMNELFAWLPQLPVPGEIVSDVPLTYLQSLTITWNTLATDTTSQFYFWRFMLGFFEGGFFPAVIVYLSIWFRSRDRARAIAVFMAASPLAMSLGSVVSSLLLDVRWLDLPGWRWIFIIEGIIPVLAGVAVLWFLPDRPSVAAWLPSDERAWLEAELARERDMKLARPMKLTWIAILFVGLLTTVYFCQNAVIYGINAFLPSIFKQTLQLKDVSAGLVAAPVYLFCLLGMLVNGWHSDKTHERVWHATFPLLGVSAMLALAVALHNFPWLVLIVLTVGVGFCLYAHLPAFWPLPSMLLGSVGAASAIGFINMVGNLGGSYGPYLIGQMSNQADAGLAVYSDGLTRLSLWALGSVGVMLIAVLLNHLLHRDSATSSSE